jgi:hypothetical protein
MKWQMVKDKQIKGEVNNKPSLTVPDQTLSIPELMKRYANGLPLGSPLVPLYEENPEEDLLGGRNWKTMDLSEKAVFVKEVQNEINEINLRTRGHKTTSPRQEQNEINNSLSKTDE